MALHLPKPAKTHYQQNSLVADVVGTTLGGHCHGHVRSTTHHRLGTL